MAIDLAAIKRRQQATWASGDYHMIGTSIVIVSEQLLEAVDVRAGQRVLDVATGSGNAALAAARRGCRAVGLDFVPVTSVFGAMFAPDQRTAAAELARVCRPGGRIGLANHTPDGFIGQLFRHLRSALERLGESCHERASHAGRSLSPDEARSPCPGLRADRGL